MLYHASDIENLKVLNPCISTHGDAYVYAIKSRLTAMLFGAPKDDFDILMDEENGITVLYECYPDALKRIYAGKKCSIYHVSEDGFLSGKTGWDAELVNSMPVEVLYEERVSDIYKNILEAVDEKLCILNYYEESEEYQNFLREELWERIHAFGITQEYMKSDVRFKQYFKEFLKG